MSGSELRKQRFLQNTFELLGDTLGASRLCYYSVDRDQNLHDFVTSRMPAEFMRAYVREMHECDPLHVRRIGGQRVARMDEATLRSPSHEIEEYERFLRCFDVDDTIDLIFRRDDRIVSGLSVMWTSRDRPPGASMFGLAERLHAYIEFNLIEQFAVAREDGAAHTMRMYHFTPREVEVAKLLCCGRTNADIATCLGIGLATVKTHLIHIFEKVGVENRSGLVARLSAGARH